MLFHKRTYRFAIWRLGWLFGWQKQKNRGDGEGGLIYYHVRWGLFIKPQVLVAQLWCAELWLMEVEDDESLALYGALPFYLPLCLHQSLTHSSPNAPSVHQQHQQALCLPLSCISSASFFLLCFFWPSRCWSARICKDLTCHNDLLYPTTVWGVWF